MIKSEWNYIRLNNHFLVIPCWCHVSVAANGFQKIAISLLKTKFLPNFNTTAPLCKSNSGDPRNFNILSHHSYNHFLFYGWGGVIGQFSLVFALAPVLKTIFHQCFISYTCSQSYSDGSVLRAIRVRLATST